MKTFLGVHKFAPNPGVLGDMGWTPSCIRRKICILRYWNRLITMNNSRLTKSVFNTDYNSNGTWCNYVKTIFKQCDKYEIYLNRKTCDLASIKEKLLSLYISEWKTKIQQMPKLRTYRQLKENFETEYYVRINLTRSQRSLIAQLRLGILPLELETGRFRNINVEQRFCPFCKDQVEDETHFIFVCPKYDCHRRSFLAAIPLVENDSLADKLKYICNNCPRKLSKYLTNIWNLRRDSLYN